MPQTDDIILTPMTQPLNSGDALDLAMRAEDYVVLEIGYRPNEKYIEDFFTATPPGLGPDCLHHFAIMERTAMVGMVCLAQGYEYPHDWWIGLMLLDPAFRGQGIGHCVVADIKTRAKQRHMARLKLSVLAANPRAIRFWQREGFIHHRDAPATAESDGHDRVVLKYLL